MFRGNVRNHKGQQFQNLRIPLKLRAPTLPVHISKVDFYLFANGEEIRIFIIYIKVIATGIVHIQICPTVCLKLVDGLNRTIDQFFDPGQSQLERMNRAFQTLQKVNAHQAANTLLTTCLGQVFTLVVGQLFIFL